MSVDEEDQQRPDAERPTGTPPPADSADAAARRVETDAPAAGLSPDQLRRLRARLARKYH
jgi:hypothetical protein